MKIKQGDKVLVEAVVDAFRTGLKVTKGKVRVKIDDVTIWIPAESIKQDEGQK